MRDSMIFYRSFAEALRTLPDEDRLRMYDAIIDFGLDETEPTLDGVDAAMFTLIRPQLEANIHKYQNGIKGGRPRNQNKGESKPDENLNKTKSKPNENQTESKPKRNVNVNDNVNENDNENGPGSALLPNSDRSSLPLSLLSYLNDRTGSLYEPTDEICGRISLLLGSGYSEADIRTVIDRKVDEWGDDPKMKAYLRPSTLFGPKFSEYLNAPVSGKAAEKKQAREQVDSLREQRRATMDNLFSVHERMSQIRNDPDRDPEEWDTLCVNEAVYEDRLKYLDERLGGE